MIETDKVTAKRCIINQQLFSETYLRELCSGKFSYDAVNLCLQIIREWREAYPDLEDENHLRQYVGQCLSALRISYTPQQSLYALYTDETKTRQTGICLIVNDVDLGVQLWDMVDKSITPCEPSSSWFFRHWAV